jgi:ribosomal protein S18 acetylase RimI-like enzyme
MPEIDAPEIEVPDIEILAGGAADFAGDRVDLEAFVAAATRGAFHHPDLAPEQAAENAWIASIAPRTCRAALDNPARKIFVAIDRMPDTASPLAGFVIVAEKGAAPLEIAKPEIDWLIVAPEWQGRKLPGGSVAHRLMHAALDAIGPGRPVQLGVIHYNARAIAFYRKFGFKEIGPRKDNLKIPRVLMIRPAGAVIGICRLSSD